MEIPVYQDQKITKIAGVLCSLLHDCHSASMRFGAEQFYRLVFYFWGYEVLSVAEERADEDDCYGDFVFVLGGKLGPYECRIGFGSCSACDWYEELLDDHFRFKESGDESCKQEAMKAIKYMIASIITDIKKI